MPQANQMEKRLDFTDHQEAVMVLGRNDENIRLIQESFSCQVTARGDQLVISGEDILVEQVYHLLSELIFLYRSKNFITIHDVKYSIKMVQENGAHKLHRLYADSVLTTARGRMIKPKTWGQLIYLEAIRRHDITLGIGPAGTGKTYLAVAMAVEALKNRKVERIILTRPAVEAGEKLGFLPGDLQEKVDPYLRPLYDALYDIIGSETFAKYMSKGIIEVAPLAYMRGRTLDDSFVILDEAQNTTAPQMKMFLTRLGFGSKMVITGDLTQIDLPPGQISGLAQAKRILAQVDGIAISLFEEADVVRHEVVSRIIRAYDNFDKEKKMEKLE
ncbi:MAG: PhoH family protein [Sporomusaceae bacterium]|nr:PhoH family protein [Sporomusaceae bacterium]